MEEVACPDGESYHEVGFQAGRGVCVPGHPPEQTGVGLQTTTTVRFVGNHCVQGPIVPQRDGPGFVELQKNRAHAFHFVVRGQTRGYMPFKPRAITPGIEGEAKAVIRIPNPPEQPIIGETTFSQKVAGLTSASKNSMGHRPF